MTVQLNDHTLHAASAEAMQAALQEKGISWNGADRHLLTEVNGQQVELVFLDTWPSEVSEEGEVLSFFPGYHANAVSRGAVPFDFGALEIEVSTPKVRWAGVGGEDVE